MITVPSIILAVSSVLAFWIFKNAKLKDGVTDWFVNRIGYSKFDLNYHNVTEALIALQFEVDTTKFDNELKTEVYQFYVTTVYKELQEFILNVKNIPRKTALNDTQKLIKSYMYDALNNINVEIDKNVKMPKELDGKFQKIRNYLHTQHTYSMHTSLQTSNKHILKLQILDGVDTNSRWFLFYTTELFDNFNGHFNNIQRSDVFLN